MSTPTHRNAEMAEPLKIIFELEKISDGQQACGNFSNRSKPA